MNSAAHDLALYLDDLSVGTFGGENDWCLNVNGEPATPNNAITIYDTGGLGPDTDQLDIERPTVQIRVRGSSFPDAYGKQKLIQGLLIFSSHEMETSNVSGIVQTSDIAAIGRDDKGNHIVTANYQLMRTAI